MTLLKSLMFGSLAMALFSAAGAQTQDVFKRPDCSSYKTERKCIREIRRVVQEANSSALQKTGLMFIYMARPDIETSAAARKAIEDKIEGSFTVMFSVAKDGTVHNVKIENVTDGIAPLAKLWADTIAQWTFTKPDKEVVNIEHRRIYLYSKDDETTRST